MYNNFIFLTEFTIIIITNTLSLHDALPILHIIFSHVGICLNIHGINFVSHNVDASMNVFVMLYYKHRFKYYYKVSTNPQNGKPTSHYKTLLQVALRLLSKSILAFFTRLYFYVSFVILLVSFYVFSFLLTKLLTS